MAAGRICRVRLVRQGRGHQQTCTRVEKWSPKNAEDAVGTYALSDWGVMLEEGEVGTAFVNTSPENMFEIPYLALCSKVEFALISFGCQVGALAHPEGE